MTRLVRWDTGELIHEHDGDIRATVEAAAKLGISCLRADLDGARLDGARLDRASLVGARLVGASLVGARLDGARLDRASLVGASLDRASLVGASLVGASLVGASLVGASLDGASLDGARLDRARLDGASLDGASLDRARLPIWCRWCVSYSIEPSVVVHIGCKSKSVEDWDAWFAGAGEFDTPRDSEDFRRIRANYLAVKAYLIAMQEGAAQ